MSKDVRKENSNIKGEHCNFENVCICMYMYVYVCVDLFINLKNREIVI